MLGVLGIKPLVCEDARPVRPVRTTNGLLHPNIEDLQVSVVTPITRFAAIAGVNVH
jgi:hypothetical protein